MTATAGITDAFPVLLSKYSYSMPATLAAGPQIWQMTNSGFQPHILGLAELPDESTTGQLMVFINTSFTETLSVSALGPDDIHDIYVWVSFSSGQTTWIEVNLAPATGATPADAVSPLPAWPSISC